MNLLSTKTVALSAMFALGTLLSSSAHAAILYTADGAPVMTKDGNAVLVRDVESDADASAQALIVSEKAIPSDRVVYFDFNKSRLNKDAKRQLRCLSMKLHKEPHKTVTVVGYADRMGNTAYNEKLALRRAKSVRDYLVAKGVKAKAVQVRSLGESISTANCPADLQRKKMISCLAEDRRVEIEVK